MAETCTWLIEAIIDEDTDEVIREERVCGRQATVVFVKRNPRHREPNAPEMLRYPRCKTHDTVEARRVAPVQGFDIQEIDQ